MNDFVSKPIEPDALWRALALWVRPRAGLGQVLRTVPAPAAHTLQDDATLAGLRGIAGLDVAQGLRRIMGKQPLYLDMLRKFAAGQAGAVAEVQVSLAAGDRATAERVAHTLKGVAGNIGAAPLQASAAQLERAIHMQDATEQMPALLDATGRLLDALVAAIARQLPALPTAVATVAQRPPDPARLQAVCTQLAALFRADDAEAVELLQQHAGVLQQAFPVAYGEMEAAVAQFDFERALALLEQAQSPAP
jgi:two-component system sensor histidine kinase/response regulator